ncbi:MAG TPA: AsmA-like C-terminal domain-containing protein [Acetobacteraceae bacterium]|nr:AsmA-like C-terminal domain-containing protein [Acetobacteraceae bacterium]
MSAVGEARQRRATELAAPSWPARLIGFLLRLLIVPIVLGLTGTGLLAWRLSQGPLEVGWLARRIEAAASPDDSPTRLQIGSASIAWQGYQEGADQGLELRLRDVRVVNQSGAPGAELDEAEVTISLGRLFELQVVPRTVALAGLRLRAVRAVDGSVSLDLGTLTEGDPTPGDPAPSLSQTMAELRRPAGTDRRTSLPGLEYLSQLQHVRVRDARVELVDPQLSATLRTSVESLELRRQGGGGVRGEAVGQLALGPATASVQLKAELAPGGGSHIEAALAPMQSAALAQASPALAQLGALDAALQATASLDLSPSMQPLTAELHASAGGGSVGLPGTVERFESLVLDASARWSDPGIRPQEIQLRRFQAVLPSPHGGWPTTIGISGQAGRRGGRVSGQFDLTLDHVAFADLPALWPPGWGGGTRPWLAQNVTSGTARDGAIRVTLEGPESDLAAIDVTQASGGLRGEDLTIHWLRPVPPMERVQAVLRMQGPDVVDITVASGTQGAIAVKDGLLRFTGLTAKDQFMALTTTLTGPVPDMLTLLRHPRLKLLDRHPLPIRSSAGSLAGRVSVELPLLKNLDADQIKVGAQGKLTALKLGGLVAGRDLDNGDIQFDVTQDGLKASGPASVANIAGMIGVEMDFRAGPPSQVVQRASITGKATPRQLAGAGVDPAGLITAGVAGVAAAYTAQRDGSAKVEVKADLKDAGVALAGWRKPPGPAADASTTILLKNDKLIGIPGIQAQGPDLQVVARADVLGGKPTLLRFDRIVLGPTQASGELRFPDVPGGPIRAQLAGPVLDLSTEFSRKPANANPPAAKDDRGTSWIGDIRFDRVLLAAGRSIGAVTAHAEYDGRRLTVLQANSTGRERIQAVIAPQGTGRRVSVRAADGGALLSALDVTDTIQGGVLALEAQYDDRQADPPLAGTLDLSDFGVHDAVAVGKLLQAVTIYGIPEAMRGQGVRFSRLTMPFRYAGDVLDIGEAQAFSASLGLTANGRIDLNRRTVNVHGTVVPVYALNSALGRIPLIGRLFSPERGGGLVAVNYSVTGALADPAVIVNPLSALTPGFLRGLFKMFN